MRAQTISQFLLQPGGPATDLRGLPLHHTEDADVLERTRTIEMEVTDGEVEDEDSVSEQLTLGLPLSRPEEAPLAAVGCDPGYPLTRRQRSGV